MVDLIYNGKSGREIAVALATRPSVPPPQKRGDWYDLGGVDGSMLSTDGTYENITIECELNFVCPPEKVGNQYRRVKEWIRGSGELCFTDDPEVYYRVKAAQVAEFARRTKRGADMIAAFICDPYTYLKGGKYAIEKSIPANNNTSFTVVNPGAVAHPIYRITGGTSSASAKLIVGGSSVFTVSRTDGIVIDTEKMIVYNTSGTQNFGASGDFDGLLIPEGTAGTTIKLTENAAAVTLEVVPNWRML